MQDLGSGRKTIRQDSDQARVLLEPTRVILDALKRRTPASGHRRQFSLQIQFVDDGIEYDR